MGQFDKVLKLYADNGMRTSEDWSSLGRDLKSGVAPCTETTTRGQVIALYTRDQTQQRSQTRHDQVKA